MSAPSADKDSNVPHNTQPETREDAPNDFEQAPEIPTDSAIVQQPLTEDDELKPPEIKVEETEVAQDEEEDVFILYRAPL